MPRKSHSAPPSPDRGARKGTDGEALRESEERYRALFEQAADAIVVFDPETLAILDFNEQACRQLGYTRTEFARLKIPDFDVIESAAKTKRRVRQVVQGDVSVFQTRQRRKDGAVLDIEIRAKAIRVRDRTLIQGIWRDITEQNRAEKGLAAERNLLRTLIDHLPDAIYVKDLERRFLLANEGLARIMGASSPDDVLGRTDEDFYPAKFSKVFRQDERRILETGRPLINKDEPRPAPDGTIMHVLTTKIPLKDATGSVIGLVGIGRDITGRKQVEEALRVSEERLKFAFRASREGVWDWNLKTDEVFFSARWSEMLGYKESEIEPHVSAWKRLLHPDDVHRAMQLLDQVQRGERDYVIEFRLRHKDGHYMDVVSRGFPVRREPGGPIIRIVGTHFDLTERKQAEAELRESERRYRLAVDFTYDWEYWLDPRGRFIYVSPSCERISGHTPAEFEANPGLLRRLIHPSDRASYDKHVRDLRDKSKPGENEWRIRLPDGSLRWIAHAWQPVFDQDGGYMGIRGSNRDITKRKQAGEALRQLNETLEKRVAERTAELSEANRELNKEITERRRLEREILEIAEQERRHFGRELHDDICQQLVALTMVSEAVASQFRKSKPAAAAELQRISEMLGETLRSARELSRGLHPTGFDSVGFISALRALAEQTNHRLRCRLHCVRPVGISNKHTALQLYRIAQEAVSNALKHACARKIVIGLRKHRDRIVLTIADDGQGLPEKPGSGLGMRSMSHRARMIGATLVVEGDRKGGTRVVCALPVDR